MVDQELHPGHTVICLVVLEGLLFVGEDQCPAIRGDVGPCDPEEGERGHVL